MNTKFENLNTTERLVRFIMSIAVLVAMMESSLVGSMLFAAAFIVVIAFATTAIIGWDPLKSLAMNVKLSSKGSVANQTQKHA